MRSVVIPASWHADHYRSCVLAVAFIILAVIVVGGIVWVVTGARNASGRIEQHLAGLDITLRSRAELHGIASKGAKQVRSLGALALTPDAVLFAQAIPDQVIRVPRSSITGVEQTSEYLEKTSARPLLHITWADDDGAWDVGDDLAKWLDALRAT
jgi:hypothetical protein